MSKKCIIKSISSIETHAVRHPVLREGKPIEDCIFDNDDLDTTIHLGLYNNHKLVGVATFLKQVNKLFSQDSQYQLRGMAVLKPYQGYYFGEAMLKHGEQLLKSKNAELIWFNARQGAIVFYEKNRYKKFGVPFEIFGVGIHYVMYKIL
jgi:ribosomal protein S18 acetylase RimI-like enzyme